MHKKASPMFFGFAVLTLFTTVIAACGNTGESAATPTASSPQPGATIKVAVGLSDFKFSPSSFTFRAGETVEFTLVSKDERHTFTVDPLKIDWDVGGKKTVRQTFTFTQPGEFELYCAVPTHKALGMVGQIRVEQ